jgi:hypothetical protein
MRSSPLWWPVTCCCGGHADDGHWNGSKWTSLLMDSGVFRLLGPRRSRAKIPHKISRDNTVQPWWSRPPKLRPTTMLNHRPHTPQHMNQLLSLYRFIGKRRLINAGVIRIIYDGALFYTSPLIVFGNMKNTTIQLVGPPLLWLEWRIVLWIVSGWVPFGMNSLDLEDNKTLNQHGTPDGHVCYSFIRRHL